MGRLRLGHRPAPAPALVFRAGGRVVQPSHGGFPAK